MLHNKKSEKKLKVKKFYLKDHNLFIYYIYNIFKITITK